MIFAILEGAAAVLTFLAAEELREQHRSWTFTLVTSAIIFGVLSAIIAGWRGV
jgi:hypothetical protein